MPPARAAATYTPPAGLVLEWTIIALPARVVLEWTIIASPSRAMLARQREKEEQKPFRSSHYLQSARFGFKPWKMQPKNAGERHFVTHGYGIHFLNTII